ncbi:hypothetical protein OIU77_003773 [Salix suchowensis]|uniref:Uncharacterized protein n=1 Tax=Salix suchowensis TaxID=1278906 RepID=A0ABQ9ATU3_9ROSI|nr:hypothetical protein OIU77_003773 [Salix suchowensis]
MSGIDLSCNRFTGKTPPEPLPPMSLQHSPTRIEKIQSLDLFYNSSNGRIPPQLHSLAVFRSLSGKTTEKRGQFGTFDETICERNHPCLMIEMENKKMMGSWTWIISFL